MITNRKERIKEAALGNLGIVYEVLIQRSLEDANFVLEKLISRFVDSFIDKGSDDKK